MIRGCAGQGVNTAETRLDPGSEFDDDARISAVVRALVAGSGLKNADLAPVLGVHRASIFAKLKGETPWKASEVAKVARYFDVPIEDLFDGQGLFGDTKKPHRITGGASDRVRHQGLEPRTR